MNEERKCPRLNEIPLVDVLELISDERAALIFMMSEGEWDTLLEKAYTEGGAILLELNHDEIPVRAYRKESN